MASRYLKVYFNWKVLRLVNVKISPNLNDEPIWSLHLCLVAMVMFILNDTLKAGIVPLFGNLSKN